MNNYVYVFSGRVLPERTYVTVGDGRPLMFSFQHRDLGLDYTVAISIVVAQLSAVVTSPMQVTDWSTLKNAIADVVGMVVDAFGYLEGRGYNTEITSLTLPDGQHVVFGVEIEALQRTRNERPLQLHPLLFDVLASKPNDFPEQVFHRQSVRYALADLRESILSPIDTQFLCYRAIESIMQGFKQPQGSGNIDKAWKRMRTELQIDEKALTDLGKAAATHRHGYHTAVTGSEREAAMKLAGT